MPPLPPWLVPLFNAWLEMLARAGVPWQAALVIAGAIVGAILIAIQAGCNAQGNK